MLEAHTRVAPIAQAVVGAGVRAGPITSPQRASPAPRSQLAVYLLEGGPKPAHPERTSDACLADPETWPHALMTTPAHRRHHRVPAKTPGGRRRLDAIQVFDSWAGRCSLQGLTARDVAAHTAGRVFYALGRRRRADDDISEGGHRRRCLGAIVEGRSRPPQWWGATGEPH